MKNLENKQISILSNTLQTIVALLGIAVVAVFLAVLNYFGVFDFKKEVKKEEVAKKPYKNEKPVWKLISMDAVVHEKDPELVKYGRDLIANTAYYLGPKGTVAQQSNGMNCQNCHLDAGSKIW